MGRLERAGRVLGVPRSPYQVGARVLLKEDYTVLHGIALAQLFIGALGVRVLTAYVEWIKSATTRRAGRS
jgi:hypothetical protein